jgi:hypothetical protein
MKVLNLLVLVSLIVAAAAECPFSGGGGNAPPTDNGAPPPPYSVTPAAPPTDNGAPSPPYSVTPAAPPTTIESPSSPPMYGPALPPASELTPGPAPSQKNKTDKLSTNYYANICPNLESLVQGAVSGMMATSPIAAAATLRLFFHDCFVTVYTFYISFLHIKKMTHFFQFCLRVLLFSL